MSTREVYVYIPRFKNEAKYTLNNELIAMGMKLPFTDAANFTGIADTRLMVSEVIHKTYIDVNEDGTEAAAVTNIGLVSTATPEFPVFRADRPFLYAIRERSTGVILFIGILGNPEKY
jgi:serpin B